MKIFSFTTANAFASLPPAIRNLPFAETIVQFADCILADSAFISALIALSDSFNGCRDLQKGCQQGATGILKCVAQFVAGIMQDEIVGFASSMIF